ncbi:MAG: DUF2905 domain-containing protein, partial [Burkholderiales bacterium]
MLRWMIVVFLALVLINWIAPTLAKLGLKRLPGDFEVRLFGRVWSFPFGSTVLLT